MGGKLTELVKFVHREARSVQIYAILLLWGFFKISVNVAHDYIGFTLGVGPFYFNTSLQMEES